MLKRLSVRNLAVVEKAEVEFVSGLNVLTGETGAGKSVLMGALELVLGGRADSGVVRDGAKEAEVEAVFDGAVVRRTVTSEGRSRAWLNDESVAVSELKDLGRKLVDIHGPRANQRILEEAFQREAVDRFGDTDAVFGVYSAAWAKLLAIRSKIDALSGAGATEAELELLRFQVNELEEAGITAEDDDIGERHAAAAHAGEIVEAANEITEALGGDGGAGDILARLQPRFAAAAKHFPAAEEWAKTADAIALDVQELSRTVADAVSRIDVDSDEFEKLDRRLTVVNRMTRKYGNPAEALEKKRVRLDELEHREERLEALRSECAAAERDVRSSGAALTKKRGSAAERIAKAVTKELRDLGFLQAKFGVRIEPTEPEASGCDRIAFMFEPNPGEAARPLADIASSGEIARVMLAAKTVLAAHDRTDTLVFDEIDANIGGEIGKAVGEKMKAVAKGRQVIAITHLPQSAVYGDRHLVVEKLVADGRTRTRIVEVKGEDRISEIARMLGGEKLTSVVRKHAEELLTYGKEAN
jgi:DNA repair protein RecN (Recombination protein N)